jgi:hypothetical protein
MEKSWGQIFEEPRSLADPRRSPRCQTCSSMLSSFIGMPPLPLAHMPFPLPATDCSRKRSLRIAAVVISQDQCAYFRATIEHFEKIPSICTQLASASQEDARRISTLSGPATDPLVEPAAVMMVVVSKSLKASLNNGNNFIAILPPRTRSVAINTRPHEQLAHLHTTEAGTSSQSASRSASTRPNTSVEKPQ